MKFILATIIAVASAILIASFGDRGYVLINFADYTIETSFVVFVALLALLLWFGRFAIWFSLLFITSPKRALNWRQERKLAKEKDLLMTGFSHLAEGRWQDAEKLLGRYGKKSKFQDLAYLGAAWSAEKMGNHQQRDLYLEHARETAGKNAIASTLAQVQFDIDKGMYQKAMADLGKLDKKHLRHPQVLRMTLLAAAESRHWDELEAALKPAAKQEVLTMNELEQYRIKLAYGRLKDASVSDQADALETAWGNLSHNMRSNPKLVNHYAQLLAYQQQHEKAVAVLKRQLDKDLDDDCLLTLANQPLSDPEQTLAQVEKWLLKRPHDDVLLLAGGLIAKQARIWGKAKSLLESSVRHRPNSTNHLALADLLDLLEDPKAALAHYRKGLAAMKNKLPEVANV